MWRCSQYVYLPPECRLSLSSSVTFTRIESSPMDFMSSTVIYRYCCWSLSIGSSPAVNIWLNKVEEWKRYDSQERMEESEWETLAFWNHRRVRMRLYVKRFIRKYILYGSICKRMWECESANKEEIIAKYIVAVKLKKRDLLYFGVSVGGLSNDSEFFAK